MPAGHDGQRGASFASTFQSSYRLAPHTSPGEHGGVLQMPSLLGSEFCVGVRVGVGDGVREAVLEGVPDNDGVLEGVPVALGVALALVFALKEGDGDGDDDAGTAPPPLLFATLPQAHRLSTRSVPAAAAPDVLGA